MCPFMPSKDINHHKSIDDLKMKPFLKLKFVICTGFMPLTQYKVTIDYEVHTISFFVVLAS